MTPIMITMTQMLTSTKNGSKEETSGTKSFQQKKKGPKNVLKQPLPISLIHNRQKILSCLEGHAVLRRHLSTSNQAPTTHCVDSQNYIWILFAFRRL